MYLNKLEVSMIEKAKIYVYLNRLVVSMGQIAKTEMYQNKFATDRPKTVFYIILTLCFWSMDLMSYFVLPCQVFTI